tara:strand:+ start:1261 stop:1476 length:216 start_codon:yes stop_codon:yes gene_type:complete
MYEDKYVCNYFVKKAVYMYDVGIIFTRIDRYSLDFLKNPNTDQSTQRTLFFCEKSRQTTIVFAKENLDEEH